MQTPVEIELSNASPVLHRRQNVTEQIKNLTLASIRTQDLWLSGRRCYQLSYGAS